MLKKIAKYSIVLLISSSAVIYAQQPARAGFLDDVLYLFGSFQQGVEIGEKIDRSRNEDGSINVVETTRAVGDGLRKFKDRTDKHQSSQEENPPSSVVDELPSDAGDEIGESSSSDDSGEDYSEQSPEDYSEDSSSEEYSEAE